jgi:hypothetical protein
MTEFVVSVSFVFLAIFVFVPSFGKIMDLQFQNLMASRYVAWERTVWFDQISDNNRDDFKISTAEFESVAVRDDEDILRSMENRFFYNHGGLLPTFVSEEDLANPVGDAPGIWNYVQSRQSMYGGTTIEDGSYDAQDTPSIAYDVLGTLANVLQTEKEPIDFLLGAVGVDEDWLEVPLMANHKTYYTPVIRTQINIDNAHGQGESVYDRIEGTSNFSPGIESAFFQDWDGVLESRSAILADGWNAQSEHYYKERADDFLPSALFDNDLFDIVIDIASILEGGPSNSAIGQLGFGDVGIEPMPAVEGEPLEASCDGGFCSFEE